MILSDFVLREQNARAPCAAPPVELRSKWFVRDRRMDRGASSFASMATEDRSKIAREAPPQVVSYGTAVRKKGQL